MRDIGSANVQGTLYDLLSPRVVGDYIENIGAACQNPDGYAANKIFVAYDSSMNQHLYKATAQITQGTQITSSNCEQTSLSELLSGSGSSSSLEDLSDTDISSKTAGDIVEYNNSTGKWENTQKLVNLEKSIAPVEDGATLSQAYAIGEKFIRGGVRYKAKTDLASGTQFSSLIINTNYEAADDVSSEIQTLTNKLDDEVETRARLGAHNVMPYPYYTSTPTTLATSLAVSEPERAVIRFNGTSVGAAVFYCGTDVKLPVGEYEISKGVNNDNVCALVEAYNGSTWVGVLVPEDYTAASRTFTLDYSNYDNLRITVRVKSGATLSNVDVKPMIKLTSDKDNTWQSPAMTNRELTDRIVAHEDVITFNENGKYIFSGGKEIISARVRSTGNYVVVIGNNGSNSAFILYNHEGTNWTRVTTQPQLTVKWVEVIA